MFEDARELSDGTHLQADICIVGAGAAGLTLATEFAQSHFDVLLVESGCLAYESKTQALYAGVNAGLLYEPLDLCRVRTFGGSTDPRGWGGWCKPLANIDFEHREWVPLSGWPITKRDLASHYRRAFKTLSLDPETEALAEEAGEHGLPVAGPYSSNEPCPLSPAPHLGEVTKALLRGAHNVRVLLNANVTELVADHYGRRVTGLRIATLEGTALRARARYFVLAAGGIENARLLLLSNGVQTAGLGNDSDWVGRCFMEHPRYSWGRISGAHLGQLMQRYDPGTIIAERRSAGTSPGSRPLFGASLALTEKAQRERRLLGARTWIVPVSGSGDRDSGREIKELVFWLKKRRLPSDAARRIIGVLRDLPNAANAVAAHVLARLRPPSRWQFITVLEQEPTRSSRVVLDRSSDALGLRRARLEWRISELTQHTLREAREIFAGELRAAGIDCSVAGPADSDSNQPADAPRWVWHHMGTTRMATDPKSGVVDRDGRVHGIANLYVAGSSVFPSVGNDMPTLTIVALAHRLADHLKVQLARMETTRVVSNVGRPRRAAAVNVIDA